MGYKGDFPNNHFYNGLDHLPPKQARLLSHRSRKVGEYYCVDPLGQVKPVLGVLFCVRRLGQNKVRILEYNPRLNAV